MDVDTKTQAAAQSLAERFGLAPETVVAEAVALAASLPEVLEKWMRGERLTVTVE